MKTWLEQLPNDSKRQIERAFVELDQLDRFRHRANRVSRDSKPQSTSTVSYVDLYGLLQGKTTKPAAQIRAAMLANPVLNTTFRALVMQHAQASAPRAAAASSGIISERVGDGFEVKLKTSKADSTQSYVQLILTRSFKQPPKVLVVRSSATELLFHILPEVTDEQFQWLASEESDLVKAIRDRETELFLC